MNIEIETEEPATVNAELEETLVEDAEADEQADQQEAEQNRIYAEFIERRFGALCGIPQ